MTSNIDTQNRKTSSRECLDSDESNHTESTNHPKNLYVSPADFEWLLKYLEETN